MNALNVVQSDDGRVFQFPTPDEAKQFEVDVKAAGGETLRLEPRPRHGPCMTWSCTWQR